VTFPYSSSRFEEDKPTDTHRRCCWTSRGSALRCRR
jgi:hypothetical protein